MHSCDDLAPETETGSAGRTARAHHPCCGAPDDSVQHASRPHDQGQAHHPQAATRRDDATTD